MEAGAQVRGDRRGDEPHEPDEPDERLIDVLVTDLLTEYSLGSTLVSCSETPEAVQTTLMSFGFSSSPLYTSGPDSVRSRLPEKIIHNQKE